MNEYIRDDLTDESYAWKRKPKNTRYGDFTTFGDCPKCGNTVTWGIGHKEDRCSKCNLLLCWESRHSY